MTTTQTTATYKVRIARTTDSRAFRNRVAALRSLDAAFDAETKIWTVSDDCIKFRTERNAIDREYVSGVNAELHCRQGHAVPTFDPIAHLTSAGCELIEIVEV